MAKVCGMDKSKKKKHKQAGPDKEKPSPEPPVAEPKGSEQKQEEEALELRLLRLQADFDNFRKRVQRERVEWQRQAHEDLLKDILPVLDHYELGLNTAISHHVEESVIDGFRMVYNQFIEALKKNEVVPIEAEGEPFDHNLHEAITYVPSDEHPAHTVIAQTRRGYLMGDKLLRPAQVVVSSGPAESGASAETAEAETGERGV
jgi:molecular chaperone GrpE